MASVTLKGDWRKARSTFGKMTDLNKTLADDIIKELAFEVKDKLSEVLDSSPSPKNTKSTERSKGFNDPLHWNGELQESDSVVVESEWSKDRTIYTIKGNPSKMDSRTHKTFEDVVTISEVGGGNVPAGQVLTITYSEMKGKIERTCIKRLNSELL